MFGFVAFGCLLGSGLGAVLPEVQCCLAKNREWKDEKKVPGEGDWRNPRIVTSEPEQFLRLS